MTPEELVAQWHADQPHPLAPSLKVGEFPTAVRLATMLKFGSGHAGPQEAANFWQEFQQMNQALLAQAKQPLSPEEFEHRSQQMARSSYAYHGRPPSMYEIASLRDSSPKDISSYYGSLPDEHYPDVSAADMAKYIALAEPHAQEYAQRPPNKLEARRFAHGGFNAQAMADYYRTTGGTENSTRPPDAGATGVGNAGGQPADQRAGNLGVDTGTAAASGPEGVSQG